MSDLSATFTQSAGVPLIAYAPLTAEGKSRLMAFSSLKIVSFCDMPLHCPSGATTHTSPKLDAASARRTIPGDCMPSSLAMSMFLRLFIDCDTPLLCRSIVVFCRVLLSYHPNAPDTSPKKDKNRQSIGCSRRVLAIFGRNPFLHAFSVSLCRLSLPRHGSHGTTPQITIGRGALP